MISIANFRRGGHGWALRAVILCALHALPAHANGKLELPPEAKQAMDTMYAGDFDGAITILHGLEQAQPENPLGYLLEGEAQWWKIFCANSQVKYGMVDAWKRGKRPEDDDYLALTDKITRLAQEQLAKSETAEMHLYAGLGLALRARMEALRGENRAVAHAGVAARAEFLRALELDPQMADATGGVGLYNDYVDSLPGIVRFLRFFMGIPGGNKKEGIQQMQTAIERGVLMPVEMRIYLAKNLRTYDQEYERAITVAEPLVERYPKNPIFQLMLGNLNLEMGRSEKAAEYFRAVKAIAAEDPACSNCGACAGCSGCAAHARELANSLAGGSVH
ncbi:MAG: tetratricopeptide repeat protein [Candidatus Acidiferrales bacterium]